jgi:phospholipase/carboxylesterase
MNADLPILAHGSMDEMIGVDRADSPPAPRGLGYAPEFHEYPMGHAVCPEEVEDISAWLGKVL